MLSKCMPDTWKYHNLQFYKSFHSEHSCAYKQVPIQILHAMQMKHGISAATVGNLCCAVQLCSKHPHLEDLSIISI